MSKASTYKKRKRLEMCLSGERPDRTPIALWRHFPVDDQSPEGLAQATLDFQKTYDFDLIKVTPTSSFCLRDWGARDEWQGVNEGTRTYTQRVIQSPEDWEHLPVLDPYKGSLGDQLTCLHLMLDDINSWDDPIPVIQTIFSPLSQAKNLVGGDKLLVHLRKYPDAVRTGLNIIFESTCRFLDAVQKTGISGIFYAVQHANYGLLTKEEYQSFGKFYDRQVWESAKNLWLNMIHLHGENIMFDQFLDFPNAMLNWHDRDTYPSLAQARHLYDGVLCGGLQRETTMVLGNSVQITAEARDAIQATQGIRFVLGTGCVLPITVPRGNILAARRSVEL